MKTPRSILICLFSLLSFIGYTQSWSETMKITASDRSWADNFGSSVEISGDIAIIGAAYDDDDVFGGNPLGNAGSAYLFHKDSLGNWQETQKIVASDRSSGAHFGISVSISGNRAIVGTDVSDAAYIFELDSLGVWQETQKITPSDGIPSAEKFGYSVGISNDYIIVGAYFQSEDASGLNTLWNAGAAYIYELDSLNVWQETQKIVASERQQSAHFGFDVSISGNYTIIGSETKNYVPFPLPTIPAAGAAYIFERDSLGVWLQTQQLGELNPSTSDNFGFSVSMDGDRAVVGALNEDENASGSGTLSEAGSAFIFDRDASGNWLQTQKIVASDRETQDRFGIDVVVRGNRIIVGTVGEDHDALGGNPMSGSGSAYIFDLNGVGVWQQVQKIVASDRATNDAFGFRMSLSDNQILVTAPSEDEDAMNANTLSSAGSAYAFCTPINIPILDSLTLPDIMSDCEVTTLIAPTATDDCGKTLTGVANVAFPISAQGQTIITWSFLDIAGNSLSQTQSVFIEDLSAPIPDSLTLSDVLSECDIASLTSPTATDNCVGPVTVTHDATLPLTGVGSTLITWTYTDILGNVSTQTQTVTITPDVTAPIPNVSVLADVMSECEVVSLTAPTANDNCGGGVVVSNDAVLPIQAQGQTMITWTYTDDVGNSSTQTQNISITDATGPTPDVANLPNVIEDCEVTSLLPPTAIDNCGGIVTLTNDAILPITTIGETIVTWTYEDENGNTTSQTQSVIITCDLSIDENSPILATVFPNPTQSEVTLSCQEIIDIEFTDLNGRVLFNRKNIVQKETINLSIYPVGLYFLRISNGLKTSTIKVIKE